MKAPFDEKSEYDRDDYREMIEPASDYLDKRYWTIVLSILGAIVIAIALTAYFT